MASKLISIITVTSNSEKYLPETIHSVARQNYDNKEYIVIDGDSRDRTVDQIKKHAAENKIDFWQSEPDSGIADAMNKGLKAAKGDYILFLHSDDYLIDETVLEKASRFIDRDHDIFLFNIFLKKNCSQTLLKPRGFNWWINFKTGVWHQGAICSTRLFKQIGNFDTSFKIAMDYDFFLRAYRTGAKVKHIDLPISVMRATGISSQNDWLSLQQRFVEEQKIHLTHCDNIMLRILYLIYWPSYIAYRKIINLVKFG